MKKIILLTIIGLIVLCGCKQESNEQETIFENGYSGYLHIKIICTTPEYTAEGSVGILIDSDGLVVSESATLDYAGESIMEGGQSKLRREGSITFDPYGDCSSAGSGDFFVNLDENASGSEDMKLWVWDGDSWELYVEENDIPINWNGGLAFSLNNALTGSGDTVGVQVSTGTVQFNLILVENDTTPI